MTEAGSHKAQELWPYAFITPGVKNPWTHTDMQILWAMRDHNLNFPADLGLIRAIQEQQSLAQKETTDL